MLSAGAGKEEFRNVLAHAFQAGASGFLAGRAIWLDAFVHYPDWDRIRVELVGASADYMGEISTLADEEAYDWRRHPVYGPVGALFTPPDESFRHTYRTMSE